MDLHEHFIGDGRVRQGSPNCSDDELANHHARRTYQQQPPSTGGLHEIERRRSCGHIDDIGDHCDDERISNPDLLEEGGAIVDWSWLV